MLISANDVLIFQYLHYVDNIFFFFCEAILQRYKFEGDYNIRKRFFFFKAKKTFMKIRLVLLRKNKIILDFWEQ